jgi:hypothetical protein
MVMGDNNMVGALTALAEIVKGVAPVVSSLLTGPLGHVIASILGVAFAGEVDPEKIAAKIKADQDLLAKLKKVEETVAPLLMKTE